MRCRNIFSSICFDDCNSFKDEAEALEIANDTLYGLGEGVWTRQANIGYRMGRGIKAGRVWVNCYHLYPAHAAVRWIQTVWYGKRNSQDDVGLLPTDEEFTCEL